jgi:hypothetical protein
MFRSVATLADEDTAGPIEHHETNARPIRKGFKSRHRYVLLPRAGVANAMLNRACGCRAALDVKERRFAVAHAFARAA